MKFISRVDALTARVEQLEAKRRADEEQQRHFDEEPIDLPPDIAELQSTSPAKKIGDDTPAPDGHLHSIAPKEELDLPEPPLEGSDSEGDLPNELVDPPVPVPEPRAPRQRGSAADGFIGT